MSAATCLVLVGCKTPAPGADEQASAQGHAASVREQAPAEPAELALPEARELLAASVAAVGGREALAAIEDFHLQGTIAAPDQNLRGTVETWWKGGDYYMAQTVEGLGMSRTGKQGDTIWADEPINGLRTLEGREAEQHTWASSLMLAADWKRFFTSATTLGQRELDGRAVYDIKLVSDSGAELVVTLDAESNLMVQQAFDVYSPLGSMPVTIRSSDYTRVNGIKIPHRQVTDAKIMTLVQELTVVELNRGVDTSKFAFPSAGAAVVDASGPPTPPTHDPS